MKKRLISALILIAYCAILIKVMVFKDIPLIKIGSLMLNFGGTNASNPANFVPFKTILPYLLGDKGLIIAGINLVGNIVLLVPVGFLVPLVFRNLNWQKALLLAAASGLTIEVLQVVLEVGIFDIDDVILNAFGFLIGYVSFVFLSKWIAAKNYRNIIIAAVVVTAAITSFYTLVIYPISHQKVDPNNREGSIPSNGDLCGGTGGLGEIVGKEVDTITLKRNSNENVVVYFTDQAVIENETGPIAISDLKIGDRVTLVGGVNPDGSFTADTAVVCAEAV